MQTDHDNITPPPLPISMCGGGEWRRGRFWEENERGGLSFHPLATRIQTKKPKQHNPPFLFKRLFDNPKNIQTKAITHEVWNVTGVVDGGGGFGAEGGVNVHNCIL